MRSFLRMGKSFSSSKPVCLRRWMMRSSKTSYLLGGSGWGRACGAGLVLYHNLAQQGMWGTQSYAGATGLWGRGGQLCKNNDACMAQPPAEHSRLPRSLPLLHWLLQHHPRVELLTWCPGKPGRTHTPGCLTHRMCSAAWWARRHHSRRTAPALRR